MASTPVENRSRAPVRMHDARRLELSQALDDAAQLRGVDTEAVSWLTRKIAENTFNLVVAGQFKRGKSSIINALLGDRLLPVGVVPLTSVVTLIRSGPAVSARAELLDGRCETLALESLADYVTERGNPKNAKGVRQVIIEHPSAWLADGVRLIDTPGIGSVYEHNTDVAQQYLPQADAVLLITSVDQPVSRAELDFLSSIRRYAAKSFCLLNKIDYLDAQELSEAVTFAREAIHSTFAAEEPIFPISARLALESRLTHGAMSADSGFPDFEHALQRFMMNEKRGVWVHSVARTLLRILAHARFALELETKVLNTPLLQIEEKLKAFEAKRRELERALTEYQVLMEAGARSLVKDQIEPSLDTFKRSAQTYIAELIDRCSQESSALSVRKLDVTLERRINEEIRAAYDGWLLREDQTASAAFEHLCKRFWEEMQASMDDLMRYSSELFSVRFEPAPDDSRWSPDSGFYYKFWYEPPGLATLTASLVTVLPRFLSRQLIVRRRKTRALELVEMQAGRLRHDFEERVQTSAQDARRRMVRRIEATLAGIAAAIDSGVAAQSQGAQEVSSGMARVKNASEAIASLETRVRSIEAGD